MNDEESDFASYSTLLGPCLVVASEAHSKAVVQTKRISSRGGAARLRILRRGFR